MRITHVTILLGLGLAARPALADDTEPAAAAPVKTKTIGIDGGIAMPTGDMSDAVGFGIGALARFEMPLQTKLILTARAGFIYHTSKEQEGQMGGSGAETSVSEIPIFGGLRYAFSQTPTTAIYGAAELGFVNYRVSTDFNGMSQSGSDTNLGMSLGAGYRTGKLDLRAGLYFPDAGELTDAMLIMATVGYDVTAF